MCIIFLTLIIHFLFFQIRKPKKVEADYDDSTDSECELDYDITDEISVEAQEQIAKYLTEKHGQQITNVLSMSLYPHFISILSDLSIFYLHFILILTSH